MGGFNQYVLLCRQMKTVIMKGLKCKTLGAYMPMHVRGNWSSLAVTRDGVVSSHSSTWASGIRCGFVGHAPYNIVHGPPGGGGGGGKVGS